MTPELITVSKIEDLRDILKSALLEAEAILGKIDKGDISPEESAIIINDMLEGIYAIR